MKIYYSFIKRSRVLHVGKVVGRYVLVVGRGEQNLCESSINVISLFTVCLKREIHELQFCPFLVILSENLSFQFDFT